MNNINFQNIFNNENMFIIIIYILITNSKIIIYSILPHGDFVYGFTEIVFLHSSMEGKILKIWKPIVYQPTYYGMMVAFLK